MVTSDIKLCFQTLHEQQQDNRQHPPSQASAFQSEQVLNVGRDQGWRTPYG